MGSLEDNRLISFKDEEDSAKVMTRAAYKLTHSWHSGLLWSVMALVLLQTLIALGIIMNGGISKSEVTHGRWVLLFSPMILMFILPLMILKLRYAFRIITRMLLAVAVIWACIQIQLYFLK